MDSQLAEERAPGHNAGVRLDDHARWRREKVERQHVAVRIAGEGVVLESMVWECFGRRYGEKHGSAIELFRHLNDEVLERLSAQIVGNDHTDPVVARLGCRRRPVEQTRIGVHGHSLRRSNQGEREGVAGVRVGSLDVVAVGLPLVCLNDRRRRDDGRVVRQRQGEAGLVEVVAFLALVDLASAGAVVVGHNPEIVGDRICKRDVHVLKRPGHDASGCGATAKERTAGTRITGVAGIGEHG